MVLLNLYNVSNHLYSTAIKIYWQVNWLLYLGIFYLIKVRINASVCLLGSLMLLRDYNTLCLFKVFHFKKHISHIYNATIIKIFIYIELFSLKIMQIMYNKVISETNCKISLF